MSTSKVIYDRSKYLMFFSFSLWGEKTNAKKTTQDMFMTIFLQCMASLELLPVVCIFKQILTLFSVTTKSIFIFLTLNLLQKD